MVRDEERVAWRTWGAVKSSQVKSSQVKARQGKSSQVKSRQVESSRVQSSQVKASQGESSQVKSKPRQVKASQVRSSQVKSSQVKSSQGRSGQVRGSGQRIRSEELMCLVFRACGDERSAGVRVQVRVGVEIGVGVGTLRQWSGCATERSAGGQGGEATKKAAGQAWQPWPEQAWAGHKPGRHRSAPSVSLHSLLSRSASPWTPPAICQLSTSSGGGCSASFLRAASRAARLASFI